MHAQLTQTSQIKDANAMFSPRLQSCANGSAEELKLSYEHIILDLFTEVPEGYQKALQTFEMAGFRVN